MRLYDFTCRGCAHQFEDYLGDEQPPEGVVCPRCGSPVERAYRKFPAIRVDLRAKAAHVNRNFRDGSYGLG